MLYTVPRHGLGGAFGSLGTLCQCAQMWPKTLLKAASSYLCLHQNFARPAILSPEIGCVVTSLFAYTFHGERARGQRLCVCKTVSDPAKFVSCA